MEKWEKQALQVTKEIVVKFIETGRISPSNFGDHFSTIYNDVLKTVSGPSLQDTGDVSARGSAE